MRRKNPRLLRACSPVLRHVFRPALSRLEERTLLSTVTWASDVSGDWDNPAMWTGGAVPGPSDDAVISFSNVTVTHDTSVSDTVDSVNCAAALDITSGSLTIDTTSSSQPTSTISGQFNLSGASLQVLAGNLYLTGGGTVSGTVSGAAETHVEFDGPTWAFDSSSSITSTGAVGFTSDGEVATVSGTYNVTGQTYDHGSTVSFTAPFTDLGSDLSVTGNAVVNLTGQSFSLATLEVDTSTLNGAGGASLTVTGTMTWASGTVTGFGALQIPSGAVLNLSRPDTNATETLVGVALQNAGTVNVLGLTNNNQYGLSLQSGAGVANQSGGSFTFQVNADVFSDGSATYFSNAGNLTQVAGATGTSYIRPAFTRTSTGSTSVQGGALQFLGGGTVSGSMTGAAGTDIEFDGPSFSLTSSSSVTSAGEVGFDQGGEVATVSGTYNVTGQTYDHGSTVSFTAPFTDLGSDLSVTGNAVVNLTGQSFSLATLEVDTSTLNGAGGASLTVTGTMTWASGTVTGFGALQIPSGAVLNLSRPDTNATETLVGVALQNAGTVNVLGLTNNNQYGLSLQSGAGVANQSGGSFTFQVNADVFSDGSATYFSNAGNLTQVAGATGTSYIRPAFTQTSTGSTSVQGGALQFLGGGTPVTIAGQVTIDSGATLAASTDFDQTGGTMTLNGGLFSGGDLNILGGAVTGSGTIYANVTNAGQVVPGGTGAAGTLTINGTYTQTAAGALDIAIGGTTAGSQYSELAVSGAATLGGTVNVGLIGGFQPALGNTFEPLTFASYTGNFGFYNGIVLGNRLLLDPALDPTNLTLTVQPAVTTTTLAAPPSPSVSGQSVTFTVIVTVALPPTTIDPVPTGMVTFFNNGTAIGTGMLSVVSGEDEATFSTSTLSTASHSITAAYTSGDANFIPSAVSASVTQVVNKAATSTTVGTSPNPSVYGQTVTITATVSVASPGTTAVAYPTGTVTFYDGGTSIGSGTLSVMSGHDQATLTTSTLSTATHSITAAYTSGDGNFIASPVSPAISQVVNKDNTTTTVAASPTSANLGQTVTFTATVTANSPGSGTPTGTVDFYDITASTDLTPGGVALSSGTATFATTSLAAGPHVIKATYSGDGNFVTSFGMAGTVTVGQSIIVLDPSAGGALSLSGNASINLPGGVYVNSNSSTALSASGNATIKATVIDVHGGAQKSGNASFSPAPTTGAAVAADPYASLPEPSTTGLTSYGSESLSGNSSATINPGIYSGISVSGNAKLTMCSGIYIIEGGGFSVSGNASVTGAGVTILNAGSKYPSTGGTYGSISLSGNGSYNLTPPTSGTYAGIVIFQSRDNTKALTISGNAVGMTGVIYAPAAALTESGNAQLSASIDVDTLAISGNGVSNAITLSSPAGTVAYTPAQIRSAYGINSVASDGTRETIAIVDAYDDPSIDQAVDAFDTQFSLTDSGPSLYAQYGPASSFLTVLNQSGQSTSLPSTDPNGPGTDNWEVEEALDVEWTHAIAPGAQIILVEANSQSLSDLMAGVATAAAQPGVSVVSMSWGFPEGQAVFAADEAAYDRVFNVPGVTFVASTGDYGAADPEYPAYSPDVVAVGGTSLTLNADGSYNSEAGWGYYSSAAGALIGSGGGLSLYEPEPAYQTGVQSTGMRTTPDVSLVADPATGAWIADPYNLDPSNPFEVVGGTSLSAPAWAGLFALVNQGRAAAGESTLNSATPSDTQQALYMLPQNDYNTITSGTNGATPRAPATTW